MARIVGGKLAVGALVCALTAVMAGDAKAGWGSWGGSWGSGGGSWGSSGGSWGSSGGSWGSQGGLAGRWHAGRSYYSAGSWGSSGGSWGSSGGSWGSSGGSWGSSGGSAGVVTDDYATPYMSSYVVRPQAAVVARSTNSVRPVNSDSARLTVTVPADARVYINDRATTSTGTLRQYDSGNLTSGKTYTYQVRAEANRDGQLVTQSETVRLRAGDTQNLAFRLERPRAVETSLTLSVPEDAIVVLAGQEANGTGPVRTFKTTKLNRGQVWTDYSIQVSVVRNGQMLTQQKTISLVGGRQESLSFAFDNNNQVASR